MSVFQDELVTAPVARTSSAPSFTSILIPGTDSSSHAFSDYLSCMRHEPRTGQEEVPWSEFDASNRGNDDELRFFVPCWCCEDVIVGGSTCPVTIHPDLVASSDVCLEVILRAVKLFDKFASDRNTRWLQRIIHIFDHLLAVPHPSDKLWGNPLLLQAWACSKLFNTTGDALLLDKAVVGFRVGLSLAPRDFAYCRHAFISCMGDLLMERHQMKGRQEDLDDAIDAYEEALALWPQDDGLRLDLIHNLGVALCRRYRVCGNVSDAESAVRHLEMLLSVAGDHPKRPRFLLDLGLTLLTRCEWIGGVADADRAIRHLKEALSLQTDDSRDRPLTLHNLATAFCFRHKMSGRVSDLDDAIRLYQSVLLTKDIPGTLNNLGGALCTRFERTRDATDLEQAILHIEKAISLLNLNDPKRPAFLNNLAIGLRKRYCASPSGDVADLDQAIDLLKQVLSLQPGNHPNRPSTLLTLLLTLWRRFLMLGNVSDKNSWLDYFRESLSLTPSDHPLRQALLIHVLGTWSTPSFWDTLGLSAMLDHCIELVTVIPQQHPNYASAMILVSHTLLACRGGKADVCRLVSAIGLSSESSAEDAALILLEYGSKAHSSLSVHKLDATHKWIKLCQQLKRPCKQGMFTRMFDLLDLSIARGCSLETRHSQISTDLFISPAKHLVSEAVAFAIDQGIIETAIEFLERGQFILLAQLSRYRSSSLLDALYSVRPDLANLFHDLSWEIEHATFTEGQQLSGMGPNPPLEDPISRSNRLKADWEDIVQEIRALDGFHHFLRPTPYSVLQQAAKEGPVILVNISESRSDAIVVTSDRSPIIVLLPFAIPDQIDRLASAFKATPQSMSNRKTLDGLKAIWDTIIEPVIIELQDTLQLPKNSRIWWCPTNAVVSLPLHAAGLYHMKDDHCVPTRECLPSLYISSYTPTLGTLIRARQDRRYVSGLPNALLVGQPNAPGQTEIPEVREEIRLVKKRIPHSLTVLMDDRGTHDAVLTGIVQHQWVHLACHGHIKSDNPLQSHFSLYDGPLPLVEIMQQRLPAAEFAFLSACHSASGDSSTPDEFLHLAAGMQFAGFRRVVGTMWAMADYAGPPLADEFYRRMLPKGGKVDHTMAAQALHGATKKLWKDGFPLAVWINFVHWGA